MSYRVESVFAAITRIEQNYKGLIIGGNLRNGIGMADRIKQAVNIAMQLVRADAK